MRPGIPYVLFRVHHGNAARVGAFYTRTLRAPSVEIDCGGAAATAVALGANGVIFFFVDSTVDEAAVKKQRGMHVCVYVSDFEQMFHRVTPWTNPKFRHLDRCDTLAQAIGSRQFRFKDVCDEMGGVLFELEHETRALTHSSYMMPLVYIS